MALAADRWPGDGPRVVALHAGVADRRSWRQVGERLAAAGLDVVAPDRRGFGETPLPDAPFSHLDDLREVLDERPGPAWLVGNSMGGGLALDAALELPGHVAGLVLLAPSVSGAPDVDEDAVDPVSHAIWTELEGLTDRDAAAALEVRLWLDGPLSPEGRVGGAARELALDMARRVLADDAAGDPGVEAWPRLGELRLPVTVAWGALDVPIVADECRALAGRIPGARPVELPGVAHLPSLEAPERVAALVLEALGR